MHLEPPSDQKRVDVSLHQTERLIWRIVESINCIHERSLNPAANCNLAKGMLAPFGNPI
jgi:hypothetical protein